MNIYVYICIYKYLNHFDIHLKLTQQDFPGWLSRVRCGIVAAAALVPTLAWELPHALRATNK